MDRVRNLFHINDGVNQAANDLVANVVNVTDEQKILLLRLFSAVKNRQEFLMGIDEPIINSTRTFLLGKGRDEQFDVGLLCKIAFNKLRATLPVYLEKNIPSDSFFHSGKTTDRKLSEFAGNIKNARDDGASAAKDFLERDYGVRLRLLGFALCAEYILSPTTPVEEFENKKFCWAESRGDKNMYAKGSPLGIQYKEGFIQQLIKSFPGENKGEFLDIFMNSAFNYKEKKEETLRLIKELLSKPQFGIRIFLQDMIERLPCAS